MDLARDGLVAWGAMNKAWLNWTRVHTQHGIKTTINEFTDFTGGQWGTPIHKKEAAEKIEMLTGPNHYALIMAHIARKQHAQDQ